MSREHVGGQDRGFVSLRGWGERYGMRRFNFYAFWGYPYVFAVFVCPNCRSLGLAVFSFRLVPFGWLENMAFVATYRGRTVGFPLHDPACWYVHLSKGQKPLTLLVRFFGVALCCRIHFSPFAHRVFRGSNLGVTRPRRPRRGFHLQLQLVQFEL